MTGRHPNASDRQASQASESATTFQVASKPLVNPIRVANPRTAPVGARLCGGTSTCIALIQIDPEQP